MVVFWGFPCAVFIPAGSLITRRLLFYSYILTLTLSAMRYTIGVYRQTLGQKNSPSICPSKSSCAELWIAGIFLKTAITFKSVRVFVQMFNQWQFGEGLVQCIYSPGSLQCPDMVFSNVTGTVWGWFGIAWECCREWNRRGHVRPAPAFLRVHSIPLGNEIEGSSTCASLILSFG